MKTQTVLNCPPAHRLALQSAADSAVMLAAILFCALLIAAVRAIKPRAYREEVAGLKEHYEAGLANAKLEMVKLIDDLVEERDAALDRAELLESQNQQLAERVAKLQPSSVESYQVGALKPKIRGVG